MIRIIDYGVGNIQAFLNVFKRLGIEAGRAKTPFELDDAMRLILPGVGAFDRAMQLLNESGMRERAEELVLEKRVPVLGVCVGMQMLAAGSDEGQLPGLNWIPGRVRAFASHPQSQRLPMPHMGWNDLLIKPESPLFKGFEPDPRFYFLHSYYFECGSPEYVAATTEYGHPFASVVSKGNIHGTQCHPEKSHRFGALLLKNFAES